MNIRYVVILASIFISNLSLQAQHNLSPLARWLVSAETSPAEKETMLMPDAQGMIQCFVQVADNIDEQALEKTGAIVCTRAGNIWTLRIQAGNLHLLAGIKGIIYADVATKINASNARNDIEQQVTKVNKVHQGVANGLPQDYFGKGVVVGIVDIGFQTNNPTFYNETGTRNRIVRYWHQAYPGTPPQGFSYGAERTDSAGIEGQPDLDGFHGTHVAGIAAGSGYTTPGLQYRGVASQADIVLVTIKYKNDTLGGSALGDYLVASPAIIDAYKYIFDYAKSVGKPAVINLSWGMHTGPHDGTSLFDKATENLVGNGHILVGANGNEGQNNMHIDHQFSGDTMRTFMIENSRWYRTNERVYADFWGSSGGSFKMQVSIIDSNLNTVASTPFISSASDNVHNIVLKNGADEFKVSMLCEDQYINNGKPNITVMATSPNQRLYYIALAITATSGKVDGWNSGAAREWSGGSFTNWLAKADFRNTYINGNSESTMGENGGTSKAVISVGAMAARNQYNNIFNQHRNDSWYVKVGDLAPFSSRGPTPDGRIKPDVAAPGYDVPSAAHKDQLPGWMLGSAVAKTVFRGDTNYWVTSNGTSMAAPHVAGVVALVLEANPGLSPVQVRDLIRNTAFRDSFTGNTFNNRFGWGKIDAYEAVKQALYIKLGINALQHTDRSILVFPNPAGSSCGLVISHFKQGAADISVTNLLGQQVLQKRIAITSDSHQEELLLDTLSSGMYMLTVSDGITSYSVKLLKD